MPHRCERGVRGPLPRKWLAFGILAWKSGGQGGANLAFGIFGSQVGHLNFHTFDHEIGIFEKFSKNVPYFFSIFIKNRYIW